MGRITLYGFYKYDPTLFDGVTLPEGINKEEVIDQIIESSGELWPSIQVPSILKERIAAWFKRNEFNFKQLHEALMQEYNPLHNFNRNEEIDRTLANSGVDKTEGSANGTGQVAAYDSSNFENSTHDFNSSESSLTHGLTTTETATNHLYGNIGVTKSQEMAEDEVNLRTKYDLYEIIAKMFEKKFLIQVY